MADIQKIENEEQIAVCHHLADEIWHEHYLPIIGKGQIDYMITNMQSVDVITDQIQNQGYQYYLIMDNGKAIGYFSIVPKKDTNELFLCKIYLLVEERGKGIGKEAFEKIEEYAVENRFEKISLNVNKNNLYTIEIYKKRGFVIVEEYVRDIGGGFAMDDYRMEKVISS